MIKKVYPQAKNVTCPSRSSLVDISYVSATSTDYFASNLKYPRYVYLLLQLVPLDDKQPVSSDVDR